MYLISCRNFNMWAAAEGQHASLTSQAGQFAPILGRMARLPPGLAHIQLKTNNFYLERLPIKGAIAQI
jgi:hypothetical protein